VLSSSPGVGEDNGVPWVGWGRRVIKRHKVDRQGEQGVARSYKAIPCCRWQWTGRRCSRNTAKRARRRRCHEDKPGRAWGEKGRIRRWGPRHSPRGDIETSSDKKQEILLRRAMTHPRVVGLAGNNMQGPKGWSGNNARTQPMSGPFCGAVVEWWRSAERRTVEADGLAAGRSRALPRNPPTAAPIHLTAGTSRAPVVPSSRASRWPDACKLGHGGLEDPCPLQHAEL